MEPLHGLDRLNQRVFLLARAELDIALGSDAAAVQYRGLVAEGLAVDPRPTALDQPARLALGTGEAAAQKQIYGRDAAGEVAGGNLDTWQVVARTSPAEGLPRRLRRP